MSCASLSTSLPGESVCPLVDLVRFCNQESCRTSDPYLIRALIGRVERSHSHPIVVDDGRFQASRSPRCVLVVGRDPRTSS